MAARFQNGKTLAGAVGLDKTAKRHCSISRPNTTRPDARWAGRLLVMCGPWRTFYENSSRYVNSGSSEAGAKPFHEISLYKS
jgi:hypothetical protein